MAEEASTTIVKRPKASRDSKKSQRTITANKREFPPKPSVTTASSLFVDAAADDFEVKGSGGAPEGGESARAGSGGAPEGGESRVWWCFRRRLFCCFAKTTAKESQCAHAWRV